MEEVTTSTLVMLALLGVMLPLARRLVLLQPGGLVGSEDKLLPLQPRPTRLKSFVLQQIVSLSRSVILLFLLHHYLGKICSDLDLWDDPDVKLCWLKV